MLGSARSSMKIYGLTKSKFLFYRHLGCIYNLTIVMQMDHDLSFKKIWKPLLPRDLLGTYL
jgi:hypothetical protein